MLLETQWKKWLKDRKSTGRVMFADKTRATIIFDRMVAIIKNNGTVVREVKVRRSVNNKRQRPNPEVRLGQGSDSHANSQLNLLNNKDLEWLAWNWRLQQN